MASGYIPSGVIFSVFSVCLYSGSVVVRVHLDRAENVLIEVQVSNLVPEQQTGGLMGG